MTILERIKYVLGVKEASVNSVAKEMGMNQTTVWRQVEGKQALSGKTIEKFPDVYPDVSAEWLLREKGEVMLGINVPSDRVEESTNVDMAAEASPYYNKEEFVEAITWKSKYEELEKRYNQLLGVALGGKK